MKRHRLLDFLAIVVVISTGLITLIGLLSDEGSSAANIAALSIQIVTVTIAVALLVGVLNLLGVHLRRMQHSEHGWPYSLITLLSLAAVVALRILDRMDFWSGDLEGEEMMPRVFEAVQVSLESALAALVLFFLVFAAFRLMRRRVTLWNLLFSVVVVVMLVGWIPLDNLDALGDVRDWLQRVPVSAGARGILIGVGLGTVMVGIRVLIGQDRSYRS